MSTTRKSVSNAQSNAIVLAAGEKSMSLKDKVLIGSVSNTTPKVTATEKPQTEKKEAETGKNKEAPKQSEKAKAEIKQETKTSETGKRLTMEELNDKAEKLNLQRIKYQTIREKRKQLETFTISHDNNNAQLTLVDADGREITTSNPKSIGKLLVDWMGDLNEHLIAIEEEMRKELEMFS